MGNTRNIQTKLLTWDSSSSKESNQRTQQSPQYMSTCLRRDHAGQVEERFQSQMMAAASFDGCQKVVGQPSSYHFFTLIGFFAAFLVCKFIYLKVKINAENDFF
jgi:hypothetical protein